MDQILHIFKKDARRHWPEIVISLALLALFTRHELNPWEHLNGRGSISPFFLLVSWGGYITLVLVIFWAFIIVRVIQDESLVGDRQWWVTKPYEWWKLFLAKAFFVLVVICVSLFHVQIFLLDKFHFPVVGNLWRVLLMDLGIFMHLFLFVAILASLTKNFGQALLTVAVIVVTGIAFGWIASRFDYGEDGNSQPAIVDQFQNLLFWGSVLAVPVYQFAHRRRWKALGLFAGAFAFNILLGVVVPSTETTETKYSLAELPQASVKIAVRPVPESTGKSIANGWFDRTPNVYLNIPVSVSGVAPSSVVVIDLMKLTADSPQDSRWGRGWKYQHAELWPEDQWSSLAYEVGRKEYEKVKTVSMNIHLELALSEYQETDPRILKVSGEKFVDPTLGICRVGPIRSEWLECLNAFRDPGFIATVDMRNSPCPKEENSGETSAEAISHAWQSPNSDVFPFYGYSPIVKSTILFRDASLAYDPGRTTKLKIPTALFCPGTDIRLSKPVLTRKWRLKLEIPNVRLEDLVQSFVVVSSSPPAI
jgi:hypothetical protein